ncbi:MAG TPA: serine/threonine-protein kinase [Myxococcales bacterium]|jgi:serine/threonine-protein kinase
MDPAAAHCPSCGAELPTPGALCARCGPTAVSRGKRPEGLVPKAPTPAAPGAPSQPPAADAGSSQELLEEGDIKVGDLLEGKWRIERELGAGGMGTVFSAHDVALDRKVAIKVLKSELCRDEEFVARFEREARATAKLEHPNVVPVHAVGRQQGRPFMVMKQLEGETLAWHLEKDGRLTQARTLELMRQICAGLGHLHANGCVHRDIKAGNIFIGPTGQATLLDFGVLRDRSSPGITAVGSIVGTPRYMSPEQARGALLIDHKADIYALGVLLFECLTGKAPFESESAQTIIRMHAESAPPDVTSVKKDLPAALTPVLRKALAKKPEDRFASTDAFLGALESALIDPQNFDPSMVALLPAGSAVQHAAYSGGSRRGWLLMLLLGAAGAAGYYYREPLLAEVDALRGIQPAPPPVADPVPPKPSPPVPDKPVPARPVEVRQPVESRRPVAPPPSSNKLVGTLRIVTVLGGRPYAANVWVDGIDRGKSPVTLKDIPASGHVVKVHRPGFQTSEQTVFVTAGGLKVQRVELVP